MGEIRFAIYGDARSTEKEAEFATATIRQVAENTRLPLTLIENPSADASDYLRLMRDTRPYEIVPCAAIAATDNLRDSRTDSQAGCANFVVVFSDNATMQQIARAIPLRPFYQQVLSKNTDIECFFSPFQTRQMTIARAFVYVREDLSEAMLRTCLQEEIFQSFGLFSDFSGSPYYSFNNVVQPKSITHYDLALLRALYHPAIKPGAPVFKVVKILMDDLDMDPFAE